MKNKIKLEVGDKINVFFNEGNAGNELLHVRAIVDEEYVVLRSWSKNKKRWIYDTKNIKSFLIGYKGALTIIKDKRI